jgi:hypothetical protein
MGLLQSQCLFAACESWSWAGALVRSPICRNIFAYLPAARMQKGCRTIDGELRDGASPMCHVTAALPLMTSTDRPTRPRGDHMPRDASMSSA